MRNYGLFHKSLLIGREINCNHNRCAYWGSTIVKQCFHIRIFCILYLPTFVTAQKLIGYKLFNSPATKLFFVFDAIDLIESRISHRRRHNLMDLVRPRHSTTDFVHAIAACSFRNRSYATHRYLKRIVKRVVNWHLVFPSVLLNVPHLLGIRMKFPIYAVAIERIPVLFKQRYLFVS